MTPDKNPKDIKQRKEDKKRGKVKIPAVVKYAGTDAETPK